MSDFTAVQIYGAAHAFEQDAPAPDDPLTKNKCDGLLLTPDWRDLIAQLLRREARRRESLEGLVSEVESLGRLATQLESAVNGVRQDHAAAEARSLETTGESLGFKDAVALLELQRALRQFLGFSPIPESPDTREVTS